VPREAISKYNRLFLELSAVQLSVFFDFAKPYVSIAVA
jgi:hypothetical protein